MPYEDAPEHLRPFLCNNPALTGDRTRDLEWLHRAMKFLEKWERVGPVEDNTWRPRRRA